MKSPAAIIAFLFAGLTVPPALASNCAHDNYRFEGSEIEYSVCDNTPVQLTYVKPAGGLERHGIKPGTILFIGREQGQGRLGGIAKVFKAGCGSMSFPVRGWIDNERIVLRGRAPVRNRDCDVVRTRDEELVLQLDTGTASHASTSPGTTDNPRQGGAPPSFACSGGLNAAEAAICGNRELSGLDRKMADVYRWLSGQLRGGELKRLTRDQRDWLVKVRNRCEASVSCLRSAYLDRRAYLEEWFPPGQR